MCDHKKKATNIHKQTSHVAAWRTHWIHTHTCIQRKAHHTLPKGGRTWNAHKIFVWKNKSCHWPLSNVDLLRCVCVCVWGQLPSVSLPPLLLPPFILPSWAGNLLFMQCLRVDGKYMQISWPYPAYLYAHLYSTFSFLCYPHRIGLNLCSCLPSKKLMDTSTISNLLSISQWHNNNNSNKNKNNLCDWPQ